MFGRMTHGPLLSSVEEGGEEAWHRCRLNDSFDLEYLVDDDGNASVPHVIQEGNRAVLEFSNYSGRIRLVPLQAQDRVNLDKRLSSGKLGDDPGIPELPSLVRQTTDSKNDEAVEKQPEEPPRKSRVSFQAEPPVTSVVVNGVGEPSSKSSSAASSRGLLQSSQFSSRKLGLPPSVPRTNPVMPASKHDASSSPQKRPSFSNFLSQRTITQLSVVDDGGQNELHRLCGASSLNFRKIQLVLDMQPELAKQVDDDGVLPLHVLGRNGEVVNHAEGMVLAKRVAYMLMEVHPNGLIHEDKNGHMPFTHLIRTWVDWAREHSENQTRQSKTIANVSSHIQQSIKKSMSRSDSGASSDRSTSASYLKFPPVMIFDEVQWCFEMLSIAIEHLGGMPLDTAQKVRPRLAYSKQREDREKLAKNVAQIPDLLKAILLLESKELSKEVLESPFVRRMLLCPEAYGPWLTQMMCQKREPASEIAVNFLVTISALNERDFVGSVRKPFPHDEQLFQEAKLSVFNFLDSFDSMIPSLLVMDPELGDRALATPLITFIMSRTISSPFSLLMGLADLKLHIAIIMAFRQVVIYRDNVFGVPVILPEVNPETVLGLIFWSQFFRRFVEAALLSKISRRVGKQYILNGWTLLDFTAIVMASVMAGIADEKHDDIKWPLLYAFVLGLLWLKVLGFMKVVNEQLATFILAVTRIIFDLRFFFLVFWMFVFMMGDMFRVVFANDDGIECEGDELGELEDDFCNLQSFDSYLRVYSVIVGDFEYEDYSENASVKALWLLLTLFGTVILLNILIAIITLSYSSCQESSLLLFRRARAEYCAAHHAMYDFAMLQGTNPKTSCMWVGQWIVRILLVLSFFMAVTWSTLFIFSRFATAISVKSISAIIIFGILSFFAVYAAMFAAFALTLIVIDRCAPESSMLTVTRRLLLSLQSMMTRLVGVDRDETETPEIGGSSAEIMRHEQLMSRLDALERTIGDALILGKGGDCASDNVEEDSDSSFIGRQG